MRLLKKILITPHYCRVILNHTDFRNNLRQSIRMVLFFSFTCSLDLKFYKNHLIWVNHNEKTNLMLFSSFTFKELLDFGFLMVLCLFFHFNHLLNLRTIQGLILTNLLFFWLNLLQHRSFWVLLDSATLHDAILIFLLILSLSHFSIFWLILPTLFIDKILLLFLHWEILIQSYQSLALILSWRAIYLYLIFLLLSLRRLSNKKHLINLSYN